jgi:predicted small lipoprotein YifL
VRARALLLALLLPAALAGCSSKGPNDRSDWERANEGRLRREEAPAAPDLPAYPANDRLVPFFVTSASDFKFFIDRASLSVGRDRIVRYTLVARSDAGAENISFEGINCLTSEYILYAVGVRGKWLSRPTEWRAIEPRSVQRWHNALQREYFCPNNIPIMDAAEGLDALERGGHPYVNKTDARNR